MSAVLLASVFSDIGDWITEATDWLADFSANWWFVLIIFVAALLAYVIVRGFELRRQTPSDGAGHA